MTDRVDVKFAKLLKEKGFDRKTNRFYEVAIKSKKHPEDGYSGPFGWRKGDCHLSSGYFVNGGDGDYSGKYWQMYAAPALGEVIDWIYKKHGFWIHVMRVGQSAFSWDMAATTYDCPYKAYIAAITYLLEKFG